MLLGPPEIKRRHVAELVDDREVCWAGTALSGRPGALREALQGCDSLIHLAYEPPAGQGFWPQLAVEVRRNLLEWVSLLDEATRLQMGYVCLASSTSVYAPSHHPVAEDAPVEGRSPYAAVKLMLEQALHDWTRITRQPASILRLATVYGPGESDRRAVPRFIQAALQGRSPALEGRGLEPFDLIYVEDVAEAFTTVTARRACGVFNIASGVAHTARGVAEAVLQACGRALPLVENPALRQRRGAVCDVSRARSELGFEAVTQLEWGLRQEINWRQEQMGVGSGASHSLVPGSPR